GLAQVLGGIDARELRGFQQRVEHRGDLGAATGLGAVMILAADDRTADSALGRVVVQRDAGIAEEARESIPVGDDVGSRLADRERLEQRLVPKPGLHGRDDVCAFGAPKLGLLGEVTAGALVDVVELSYPLERKVSLGV